MYGSSHNQNNSKLDTYIHNPVGKSSCCLTKLKDTDILIISSNMPLIQSEDTHD